MCGIYGCFNVKQAVDKTFEGLKRLEYRGYDSWGIGWVDDEGVKLNKEVGILPDKISGKIKLSGSMAALGHTRWATHGKVSRVNAHPHESKNGDFVLAHNGVVENFEELREEIEKEGYSFVSETDSEVIVGWLELLLDQEKNVVEVMLKLKEKINGRNSVVMLMSDGTLAGLRNGSPLVLGRDKNGQWWVASDTLSLAGEADEYLMLQNGQAFLINQEGVLVADEDNSRIETEFVPLKTRQEEARLGSFDSYFLKEIFDTPRVLRVVMESEGNDMNKLVDWVKEAKQVLVVGSGTAGMAAEYVTAAMVKEGLNARSAVGAEAKQMLPLLDEDSVVIALSQSGETADVLAFLEEVKQTKAKIVSYVNMPGSMMSQMSDIALMAHAGAEKSVMSSKVFSSQCAWGYLLAKSVVGKTDEAKMKIRKLANEIKMWLGQKENLNEVAKLAESLVDKQEVFIMGAGANTAVAKEAMIKLIEGSYIHAHAIPAGDLKHYAITLMEPGVTVLALTPVGEARQIMKNAVAEVRARGARVIEVGANMLGADENLPLPYSNWLGGLGEIIPMQLLTYYLAKMKGHNIDKPRNIAKSVTVL